MSETIEQLLVKNGIAYTISGKDFVTKCFNPDHVDSHPSFRVDRNSGLAHCFSCGFKVNLFRYYGILTVGSHVRVAKLKDKLQALKEDLYGLPMLKGFTPYNVRYRGISRSTFEKFEAGTTNLVDSLENRVIFPIRDILGRIVVFVGRHTESNSAARYINYPAGASMPLYPATPVEPTSSSLVLVEGIFDMLNLYDKGLTNVACCFGTNTIKNSLKEKLLPYKICGVTKIYLMFDGDFAGQKAAQELKPLIEELDLVVEILPIEEDTDPGDLSQYDVTSTINYITK